MHRCVVRNGGDLKSSQALVLAEGIEVTELVTGTPVLFNSELCVRFSSHLYSSAGNEVTQSCSMKTQLTGTQLGVVELATTRTKRGMPS